MPQFAREKNPAEIDISSNNSKRRLLKDGEDPTVSSTSSCSPFDHTTPPKKQKTDKDDTTAAPNRSAPSANSAASGDAKTTIDGSSNSNNNSRVDPTELASAFALASLAGLGGGNSNNSNKEETRDGGLIVRNMESWDETRSPKADYHPMSPDQRSPGSAFMGVYDHTLTPPSAMTLEDRSTSTGSAGRKVTFAPNTKEETSSSSSNKPLRLRLAAASRRLAMPMHYQRGPMPPPQHGHDNKSNGMIVSPLHHRMYGSGGMPPLPLPHYLRTPPHMPGNHLMHHGPPPPPPHPHHHPAAAGYHPHHMAPPGPGSYHRVSPPQHHYGSPAGTPPQHHHHRWQGHGGQHPRTMAGGYPPRHLMQPPLMHRSDEPTPPSTTTKNGNNQWICDFCNVASFGTYEEACIHEEACSKMHHRVLSMSSSSGSEDRSIAMSRSRSMDEEAAASFHAHGASPGTDTMGISSHPLKNVNEQEWFDGTLSLALEESDREWLSEADCYIRSHCVEVFSATAQDVAENRSNHITLQQVGVRCCFCASHASKQGDESKDGPEETSPQGSKIAATISFPTTVAGIYDLVKRWQRVHLEACAHIPENVRDQLSTLANNNNAWVPTTRQYWADSARTLGLVDTTGGIRFGKDLAKVRHDVKRIAKVPSGEEPPSPQHFSRGIGYPPPGYHHPGMLHFPSPTYPPPHHLRMQRMDHLHQAVRVMSQEGGMPPPPSPSLGPAVQPNAALQQQHMNALGGHIAFPQDMEMIPPYVYYLMRQVEPCLFTEADRFVARSKGPVGYPGFQCRHCQGHAGLGKYFPISSKSLSTNSTSQNIHAHLLKCRKCPDVVKDRLVQLKIEKSRAQRLEPGWRKIFFDKVWARLHLPGTEQAAVPPPTPSAAVDEASRSAAMVDDTAKTDGANPKPEDSSEQQPVSHAV